MGTCPCCQPWGIIDLNSTARVIIPKMQRTNTSREIFLLSVLFLVIVTLGVFFYRFAEDFGWIDAIYFTTVTLTTLGYGDLVPRTDIGKLFTSVYAFLGIGMFLGLAGIIFHNVMAYSKEHSSRADKQAGEEKN